MIDLYIATPENKIFEGRVKKVSLPSSVGVISILAGHEPIMSTIESGEIRFEFEDKQKAFAAYKGVINIENNKGKTKVVVLLENTEDVDIIDMQKAKQALERAKEVMLAKPEEDDLDLNGSMLRELNRIKLAKKYNR